MPGPMKDIIFDDIDTWHAKSLSDPLRLAKSQLLKQNFLTARVTILFIALYVCSVKQRHSRVTHMYTAIAKLSRRTWVS